MIRSTRLLTGLALLASGALLTACGGSGTGSSAIPATPISPQPNSSVSTPVLTSQVVGSQDAALVCSSNKRKLCSRTFEYTGAPQAFNVPAGVTKINAYVVGAGAAPLCSAPCAAPSAPLGEEVVASFHVTPGRALNIYVGGSESTSSGAGGFNGGGSCGIAFCGGAGASDIREDGSALSNRIIVAGGAGGYGEALSEILGEPPLLGGAGGFMIGSSGADVAGVAGTGGGGGAQTQTNNAGTITIAYPGYEFDGSSGTLGVGGAAEISPGSFDIAGAGGGGYYGGGSGAYITSVNPNVNAASGAGGGGGSSFVESGAINVSYSQATANECDASNDGCITITW